MFTQEDGSAYARMPRERAMKADADSPSSSSARRNVDARAVGETHDERKRQGAGALRSTPRPPGPPPLEPRAAEQMRRRRKRFEASLRNTARQRSSPIRYAPRSGGCATRLRPARTGRAESPLIARGGSSSTRRSATRIDTVYRECGASARGRTKAWYSFAFSECVQRHQTRQRFRRAGRARHTAHRRDARNPLAGTAREHE